MGHGWVGLEWWSVVDLGRMGDGVTGWVMVGWSGEGHGRVGHHGMGVW